jgi:hypothetical protein
MTRRAVTLGLLGAAAICAFGFFNDMVMQGTHFVGNYMPISVYGLLILFLLFANPLLMRAHRRLALTGRELAVIIALILPACYVPGRGLMHYFTTVLMMPHHYERTEAGWQEQGVVQMVPEVMLAGVAPDVSGDDILDPRGLSLRLVRDREVAGADTRSAPVRRIWELLTDEGRKAIRAGLERARLGPDKSWRPKAEKALDSAFQGREERRRRQEVARAEAREGGQEDAPKQEQHEEELKELSAADADALRGAVAAALAPPGPESLGGMETVRALDAKMEGLGFSSEERTPVSDVVREALAEAEAPCRSAVVSAYNGLVDRRELYSEAEFSGVILPDEAKWLVELGVDSLRHEKIRRLNRHLVDSCFPREMASLAAEKDYAVSGFVQGIGIGTKDIELSQIPWYAWTGTLFRFWLPLLLAFSFAVIGLALVVHRQWSDHEHLPYPIVTFAQSLLPAEGESSGGIFRNRLFWMAAGTVLFIHLNNYACLWWPKSLVPIPSYFDFRSLSRFFPTFQRGGDWMIMDPTIYFTAIGFAYFVATDVSLSLGLAPFVYATVAGFFVGHGVSFWGGGWFSTKIESALFSGAYFGTFAFLAYTGRRYFAAVFRRSLFLSAKDEVEPSAVWGARVFMVGVTFFAFQLISMGLGWQWAVLYTLGAALLFIVMSRVVAETGMFFIHAYWFPGALLHTFLGPRALGPQTMLLMFLVSCVLLIDPREAVMPFAVHALRLADARGAKVGRTALWGGAALVIGFAVALPIVLYLQYGHGATVVGDGWTMWVPRYSFDEIVGVTQRLEAQGALGEGSPALGTGWLSSISPTVPSVIAFGAALALVLLFGAARLRFPRWPLHPVLFVALGSWQSRCLAVSFLIGWFIKVMVTKYGGAGVYQKLKPLMIGLIAGDMLGGVIPMIIGAVYYLVTDEIPKSFRVLPT